MKLLHAADLHLDSPFHSLSREEARLRRAEQRKLPQALRDAAQEHQVDLVLLAGDLFDCEQTHPETVTLLAKALGEMGCPVVIAPGNHDYYSPHSPYATVPWPENVHIFTAETVEGFHIPKKNVTVYGYAFRSPQLDREALEGFTAPDDGAIHLGCFHGQVGAASGHGYAPITPASLAQSGLRYAALGHVHAFGGVETCGKTYWAYSGCPQGRGFDETGSKGCLLVELNGELTSAEFLPLAGPRYELLRVNLTHQNEEEALRAALMGHENDYCRVTLTGEADAPDLAALHRSLQGLCRMLQLRDETTVPVDLWRRAEEENLTGMFLQAMRRRISAAEDSRQDTLRRALWCGLAALEGREYPDAEVTE